MYDAVNYLDSEEFEIQFPILKSIIRNRKFHLQCLMIHFSQYINDDMKNQNRIVFYSNYNNMMKVCNVKDRTSLSKTLALFSFLNMLNKEDSNNIPEAELKKAKSIAARYGHNKLTTFISFPDYGVNQFENSEEKAITLKESNFTLKGLSREYILRTFGKEEADRIYPQYEYENSIGTSKKSNKITERITKIILKMIDQQGYILEQSISEIYIKTYKNYSKKQIETQVKRSIQEILDSYNLQRAKLNKKLKQQYKITSKGYPFLIIRSQPVE